MPLFKNKGDTSRQYLVYIVSSFYPHGQHATFIWVAPRRIKYQVFHTFSYVKHCMDIFGTQWINKNLKCCPE